MIEIKCPKNPDVAIRNMRAWYLTKRKTKRYFYVDEQNKEIDRKIPVYKIHNGYCAYYHIYAYNPAPSQ